MSLTLRLSRFPLPALLIALLAGPGGAAGAQTLTLKTVAVCDDVAEWPPFTYRARVPGANGSGAGPAPREAQPEVVGYSVEVLRRILAPLGIAVRIELLPWVRCLREVESGQNFQMALNASFSQERQQRFLLSQPYYETTHTYFYSRRRYPNGVAVRRVEDLAEFHVCGVHGYNYSAYGLRDEQVDRGALDFSRVIAKLLADRCEIGIEKLEAVQASRYTGRDLLADPDIAHAPIPGMPKGEFHMVVSRQHPQGKALVQALNAGLKSLRDSGQLQAIRKSYLP